MSSAAVSVVVPTYNSERVVDGCLRSIAEQSVSAEIIVSDGGSGDRTVDIARSYGARIIQTDANRSAQRNSGAQVATGQFVVFVDSDMILSPDVLKECISAMVPSVAALVIPEIFVGEGFWARVRGFERGFYDDVWYLEAARFYRLDQFLDLGGFDTRLIGPEDWDLDQRIRKFGRVDRVSSSIFHHEGRLQLRRLLDKKAHYSDSFPLFSQLHPGRADLCFSPLNRLNLFLSKFTRVLQNPLLALGTFALGASELLVSRRTVRSLLGLGRTNEKVSSA